MGSTVARGKRGTLIRLISFDIDGTLEVGDPPGLIPMEAVRRAIALGFVVGSCSDRPLGHQRQLWEDLGVEMHFAVLKQQLSWVREAFPANHYLHIGDSPVDRWMARDAGFDFIHVEESDVLFELRSLGLLG
ncbi:MAG: HAD family hydrolase [Dehalococcoidia bacterium]|nr:HAD family hydrolase [Dehalococcoidia bacterium]